MLRALHVSPLLILNDYSASSGASTIITTISQMRKVNLEKLISLAGALGLPAGLQDSTSHSLPPPHSAPAWCRCQPHRDSSVTSELITTEQSFHIHSWTPHFVLYVDPRMIFLKWKAVRVSPQLKILSSFPFSRSWKGLVSYSALPLSFLIPGLATARFSFSS